MNREFPDTPHLNDKLNLETARIHWHELQTHFARGMVVWVEELYLAPACRGKGYGGKVLQFLKTEYAGRAARIRLEVTAANPRARALYEREGFTVLNYTQMVLEDF